MSLSADRPATRTATRLAFLVAGFGMACWAPLVPFAKLRVGVDDGELGLLLLCIGLGSISAMIATGPISARFGSRPVIVAGGLALAATLPFLALAATPVALGAALFVFGGALGSIDVAMNIHAVEVERAAARPLMSGFHALFSIGGFAGAALMTVFLTAGLPPLAGTLVFAALIVPAILIASPRLLPATAGENEPLFVRPRGVVLLLAILAAAIFLVEGAMLDWSALLIAEEGLVARDQAGLGYILFSIAMTIGPLGGDRLTARIGDRSTLIGSGTLAVAGLVVLLTASASAVALAGFLLVGFGASNIVPVLFRRAGSQETMPPALAIGAITTMGYAGILAGPAVIGFVAHGVGLSAAFWMLASLLCLVPLSAAVVTKGAR